MKRSKQTKKALTGSVLALVLCFVMLLGTTFAWFTDTASTKVNTIKAGTLDIVLEQKVSESGWKEIKPTDTLDFVKAAGAAEGEAVLWEPGCTYQLPTLRVRNNGNLALKYKVVFTPVVAKAGDEKLAEVLYVVENGDVTAVTLKDVFAFTPEEDSDAGILNGNLKPGDTSEDYTIALHMDENAGNAYQGMCIESVYVTVLATQDTVEYDSSTNDYDKDATYPVTNVTELREAIKKGENVVLANDITVTETRQMNAIQANKTSFVIDANGKTLTDDVTTTSDYNGLLQIYGNAKMIITGDGTFKFSENVSSANLQLVLAQNNAVVTIENGTFDMGTKSGYAVQAGHSAKVYIKGGNFIGEHNNGDELIYAKENAQIYISGGFFTCGKTGCDILNVHNTEGGTIEVTGGTFVNFNPATDNSEGEGHSWVAEGYKVVSETHDNDIWYTVVPET